MRILRDAPTSAARLLKSQPNNAKEKLQTRENGPQAHHRQSSPFSETSYVKKAVALLKLTFILVPRLNFSHNTGPFST